jgi:hypothetical protein
MVTYYIVATFSLCYALELITKIFICILCLICILNHVLLKLGRCYGMEMNVEKTKVMRI